MSKLRSQGGQKKLREVLTTVRVELGVKTLYNAQMVTITNRDHTLHFRSQVNQAVLDKMAEHRLRFFHAKYNPRTTEFTLMYSLPDEEWT